MIDIDYKIKTKMDPVTCVERLISFKNQLSSIPAQNKQEFALVIEKFWSFLISIQDNHLFAKLQDNRFFPELKKYLANRWHEYISLIEIDIAKNFLETSNKNIQPFSALSAEDYIGVNKELSLINKSLTGLTVIMAGCGPFPETLMEIYKGNPAVKMAIGIEERSNVSQLANKVISKNFPDVKNVKVVNLKAENFDYQDVDIIFLANGLLRKEVILDRIYNTAKDDVKILARNPILMGKLLYEDILSLPSMQFFNVLETIQASTLSKTLLLKKRVTDV